MTKLTRYQKLTRDNIAAYFRKSCKYAQKLGFELEHILLHEDGRPVSYTEPGGVRDVLTRLAQIYGKASYEDGNIIGVARKHEVITIEPADQLEISLGPYRSVMEIEASYLAFRDALDPILEEFGLVTPMLGYNPAACARDLELVPKFRYRHMAEFLGAQAYEGICMMRGSSAVQISIDYENEADAALKMRIAETISPILALICDNSPIFELEERTANLVRTRIWSGMKQDRTGTVPGSLKTGYSFSRYADYIMTREAIIAPEQEGDGWRYVGAATFDELYADRAMAERDIEHALSMVWPDARLKG